MTVAVDASSPAAAIFPTSGSPLISASFTAPSGARILVNIADCSTGGLMTYTVSDTGGLTWVRLTTHATEANEQWISSATPSAASRTISVANTGSVGGWGYVALVLTGMHATSNGAVNNGGTSTTNNLSVAVITTTATNSLVIANGMDDAANGTITSTDTLATYDFTSGNGAVVRPAAVTPGSGTSVTLNFDAGGAGAANWRWTAVEILDAGGVAADTRGTIDTRTIARTSMGLR
jgi:hypothetical protein